MIWKGEWCALVLLSQQIRHFPHHPLFSLRRRLIFNLGLPHPRFQWNRNSFIPLNRAQLSLKLPLASFLWSLEHSKVRNRFLSDSFCEWGAIRYPLVWGFVRPCRLWLRCWKALSRANSLAQSPRFLDSASPLRSRSTWPTRTQWIRKLRPPISWAIEEYQRGQSFLYQTCLSALHHQKWSLTFIHWENELVEVKFWTYPPGLHARTAL